jgi:NADH:ubiquinone oxidoreductase subunit 2 (subunit N)
MLTSIVIVVLTAFIFFTYANRLFKGHVSNKFFYKFLVISFAVMAINRIIGNSIHVPFYSLLLSIITVYGMPAYTEKNKDVNEEILVLLKNYTEKVAKAIIIGGALGYLTYVEHVDNL